MDLQRLYTRVEIKAVDTTQRLIQGYAAAFSNKDRVGDVIEPGAFDRTLKENDDVLVFIGHDASRLPVGEPVSIRTEAKGLLTSTRVYNTPAGDELLEVAKQRMASGRTLGMSIGYRTIKQRLQGGARHLLDVDLMEYSFLASPALAANPEATMTGVKQRGRKATGVGTVITTEDSYEELREDLQAAANLVLSTYSSVCATFSDHVIVCGYSDGDNQYWEIPYTLDADGDPVLGEPSAVEPAFVPAAVKALAESQRPSIKTPERKAIDVKDLPDDAFAFIEAGGNLDEEQKTVPRSNRHFPHHLEDGALDVDAVKSVLADSDSVRKYGTAALAHLQRHANAAWSGKHDDAHNTEWKRGAPPALLVLSAKLADLAQEIANEQVSMVHLDIDTKGGHRIRPELRQQLDEADAMLREVISWAETVDRGQDGKAHVDLMRHKLALLDLEV